MKSENSIQSSSLPLLASKRIKRKLEMRIFGGNYGSQPWRMRATQNQTLHSFLRIRGRDYFLTHHRVIASWRTFGETIIMLKSFYYFTFSLMYLVELFGP